MLFIFEHLLLLLLLWCRRKSTQKLYFDVLSVAVGKGGGVCRIQVGGSIRRCNIVCLGLHEKRQNQTQNKNKANNINFKLKAGRNALLQSGPGLKCCPTFESRMHIAKENNRKWSEAHSGCSINRVIEREREKFDEAKCERKRERGT